MNNGGSNLFPFAAITPSLIDGSCLRKTAVMTNTGCNRDHSAYNSGPSHRHSHKKTTMTTKLAALREWVDQVAETTQPEKIHWCDGSHEEAQALIAEMKQDGLLASLDEDGYPNCYLHLSDPNDVARVEHLTFVCTPKQEDAGPNNNWMSPDEAHAKMDALFDGCMQGRTMYVIPYCMGPIDSPYSRCGVEITDSPYVVVNMKLMTRMGARHLRASSAKANSSKACTRPAISIRNVVSSCISRMNCRSRASARATAATRCSARSAMRCESPATRHARKAGSPSIC